MPTLGVLVTCDGECYFWWWQRGADRDVLATAVPTLICTALYELTGQVSESR